MPAHSEQQLLPYTPQQLFDLVLDIERYPEFLPWCRTARILERSELWLLGELVIAFSHFTESYISRVDFTPATTDLAPAIINVSMVKGPFEYLANRWKFTPVEGGTQLDFFLDFKFRSKILDMMIGTLFGLATSKMVNAFKTRAEQLYGNRG